MHRQGCYMSNIIGCACAFVRSNEYWICLGVIAFRKRLAKRKSSQEGFSKCLDGSDVGLGTVW